MKPTPIVGKMSTFGGVDDMGVAANEGVSLLAPGAERLARWKGLFRQPTDDRFGLARNLNPDALYCAMRWDYRVTPVGVLWRSIVRVVSKDGNCVWVRPVDWGPNEDTGRIIDLSPAAAKALELSTGDTVEATLITPEMTW